MDLLTETAKAH